MTENSCRYKLLLESLLNKTPREHPDFEKLQGRPVTFGNITSSLLSLLILYWILSAATVEINKVAHHINENVRQRENFQKMLSIQKSLTGVGAPKVLAPGEIFGSYSLFFAFFGTKYLLLRGKGHKRTSKSYMKVRHPPPPPPFTYERQPQHRDHPTLFK